MQMCRQRFRHAVELVDPVDGDIFDEPIGIDSAEDLFVLVLHVGLQGCGYRKTDRCSKDIATARLQPRLQFFNANGRMV
jgi:hypothetical protein